MTSTFRETERQDTVADEVTHIAYTRMAYLCGSHRDPGDPIRRRSSLDAFSCVVCVDLWQSGVRDIL